MTNVRRWLAGAGALALLGIVLMGVSTLGAQRAAAESPPAPPARFVGTVTVDGRPATPGTVITAYVGSTVCKVTQVQSIGAESRYTIDVPALDPGATPNCGTDGAVVTFYIGDRLANETGRWRNYDINVLNLSVTTPTPTATAPPAASPSPGATQQPPGPAATPQAPRTGELAQDNGTSAAWLFVVIGLGAVALGAGGVAATRRSR